VLRSSSSLRLRTSIKMAPAAPAPSMIAISSSHLPPHPCTVRRSTSTVRAGQRLGIKEAAGDLARRFSARSRLLRPGAENLASPRQPVRPEVVTHAAGMFLTDVSGLDKRSAGGDGGIRTLDRALQPYNGLANRRLQPLGHVSVHAENGALWKRSPMLAEVCPSPGAMARGPRGGGASQWRGRRTLSAPEGVCVRCSKTTPTKKATGETSLYSKGAAAKLRSWPGGSLRPNQNRTPLAAARS
jgi:hypothetical protein